MTLLPLIKKLGYGVLNNTNFSRIDDLGDPEQILPLVTLIDEGLTRLYSRFMLRERHVIVEMQVGVTFYHFSKLYTVQNGDPIRVPYPYIMDLPNDPFDEDLVKVLRIYDSTGKERPLDDENQPNSLFMVQHDVMHNPYPREGEVILVAYQAKHKPLMVFDSVNGTVEFEDEIILPPVLEPALDNYVAYMVHMRIGTSESLAKAQGYLAVYNQICEDVEKNDLVNSSRSITNARFDENGWI